MGLSPLLFLFDVDTKVPRFEASTHHGNLRITSALHAPGAMLPGKTALKKS
jgi:hypothetical protein